MTYRPENCNSQVEGFSEVVYRYPRHWDVGYIPEWAKYQAVDEDGTEYFYEFEPIPCGNGKWLPSKGRCIKRLRKISNWKETLSSRILPLEKHNEDKKKRVKQGRGRPRKKPERKQVIRKLPSLKERIEKLGVFKDTESGFNDYLKRYLVIKTINGEKFYCRGSTQDFFGVYSYRFTSIQKKNYPKLKYYTTEHFAQMAIDLIVELGQAEREELSIEFGIYELKDGRLVKSIKGMNLYNRYIQLLESYKQEKESRKNERMESDIRAEEAQN